MRFIRYSLFLLLIAGMVLSVGGSVVRAANPPMAVLNLTQGNAGSAITVTGSGWRPGDPVNIEWTDPEQLVTTHASADGTFTLAFTIPINALPGVHMMNVSAGCALCTYGASVQVAFIVVPGAATVPSAETALGGLDLVDYCQAQASIYLPGAIGTPTAFLRQQNADGWRCGVIVPGAVIAGPEMADTGMGATEWKIDMSDVCRWQYGGTPYAQYRDQNDPDSWQCYPSHA